MFINRDSMGLVSHVTIHGGDGSDTVKVKGHNIVKYSRQQRVKIN